MYFFNRFFEILVLAIILMFFAFGVSQSQIMLTKEQQEQLINRLEKDKQIILQDKARWEKIRKETPKIEWELKDDYFILQKMEVPVYKDNPLIYETKWKIDLSKKEEGLFPLTLRLAGTIESSLDTDFKLGLKVIGFKSFNMQLLQPFGVNVFLGIKSSGLSISYDFGKPFSNVAIHLYSGFQYKISDPQVFGLGVSVNL